MPLEPTEREKELAAEIERLRAQLDRPKIAGSSVFTAFANRALQNLPRTLLTLAALVWLAVLGVHLFYDIEKQIALTGETRAKAASINAEAEALRTKSGEGTNAEESLRAEIANTEAEAARLRAENEAQASDFNGMSTQLATISAEIDKATYEANRLAVEIEAKTQLVDNMPMAVAQQKANVEKLEATVQGKLAQNRNIIDNACRLGFVNCGP